MGVSIGWQRTEPRTNWLTPGWRSMMHELLMDNGMYGVLYPSHAPLLREVGDKQMKGLRDPPFDYSDDIKACFEELATALEKHGEIVVVYAF